METDTKRDRIIVALFGVLLLMLVAMFLGGSTGQVLFSYTIIAFFGLYLLNGVKSTAEKTEWRPFVVITVIFVTILAVMFAALWYFHFQNPAYTDPVYWLGFPRATAVLVYGLWMPPALVLMFAYPYLFDGYIWQTSQAEEFAEYERKRTDASFGGDD